MAAQRRSTWSRTVTKAQNGLQSRTCWTILAFFILNIEPIRTLFPTGWETYINIALAAAAMYFRLNPQEATKMGVPLTVEPPATQNLPVKEVEKS